MKANPTTPTLAQATERMRARWDTEAYPKLVYVSTTNWCNGRCLFCPHPQMERPVEEMSMDRFRELVGKVKARGIKIGAMFCFGEPLGDRDLFAKIAYARAEGVLTPYIGLNTNCSLLTPEKFDRILATCGNLTLSFVHTGKEYERLTGLPWDLCYKNACDFIRYRDAHQPKFQIEIGCNDVQGHDRDAVACAFKDFRVDWARDAEVRYSGKTITGVIDRSIMRHEWVCDGYKGAMQIMPNGDCTTCAFDVVRSETRFANVFTDDWDEIERKFRQLWRRPSSFCLRCDFWWNYQQMIAGGWERGPHIDSSWQAAYGDDIAAFWAQTHDEGDLRFLTGSPLFEPAEEAPVGEFLALHRLLQRPRKVLDIGLGNGRCTRELREHGHQVSGLDISAIAIRNARDYLEKGFTKPSELPDATHHLAICHLVVQHMTDVDVYELFRNTLRSLMPGGILAVQYASPQVSRIYSETLDEQKAGIVQRTPEHFRRLVEVSGGQIIAEMPERIFDQGVATDDNAWNGVHIARRT